MLELGVNFETKSKLLTILDPPAYWSSLIHRYVKAEFKSSLFTKFKAYRESGNMVLLMLALKQNAYLNNQPIIEDATDIVDKATNHKGLSGTLLKLSRFDASFMTMVVANEIEDAKDKPQPKRHVHLNQICILQRLDIFSLKCNLSL